MTDIRSSQGRAGSVLRPRKGSVPSTPPRVQVRLPASHQQQHPQQLRSKFSWTNSSIDASVSPPGQRLINDFASPSSTSSPSSSPASRKKRTAAAAGPTTPSPVHRLATLPPVDAHFRGWSFDAAQPQPTQQRNVVDLKLSRSASSRVPNELVSPKSKPYASASPAAIRQRLQRPPTAPSPRSQQVGLQDRSDSEAEELEANHASPIRKSFGSAARRFFKKTASHGRSLSSDHGAAAPSQPPPFMVPFTMSDRGTGDSSEGDHSPPALHYGSETASSTSMESLFCSSDGRSSALGCPVQIPERRRGRKGSLSGSTITPLPLSNLFGLGLTEGRDHLTTPRPAPPVPAAMAPTAAARIHGHRRVDSTSRGAPRAAMELQGGFSTVDAALATQRPGQSVQIQKAPSLKYDPSRRPKFPPTPPKKCVKDLPNLQDASGLTDCGADGSPFARPKTARGLTRPGAAGKLCPAQPTSVTPKQSALQDAAQLHDSSSNVVDEYAEGLQQDVLVAMTFESQQRDREILAPLNIQKKARAASSSSSTKRPCKGEEAKTSTGSQSLAPAPADAVDRSSVKADGKQVTPEDDWQSGATAKQWSSMLHDGGSRRRPKRTTSPVKQRKVSPPPPTCDLPALPANDTKSQRPRPLVSSPEAWVLPLPTEQCGSSGAGEEVCTNDLDGSVHLPPKLDLDLGSGGTLRFPRQPGSGASTATPVAGRTPATATTRPQQLETMLDAGEPSSSRAATPAGTSGPSTPASGASTQWARWPSLRRARPTPTSLPTSVLPYEVEHPVTAILESRSKIVAVAAGNGAQEADAEQGRDEQVHVEQEDLPRLNTKRSSPPNLAWHLDALRLDLDDVDLLLHRGDADGDASSPSSSPPSATPSSMSAGEASTDGSAYSAPSMRGESFEYELGKSGMSSRVVSLRDVKGEGAGSGRDGQGARSGMKGRPASSIYGGVDLDGEDIAAAVSALMA